MADVRVRVAGVGIEQELTVPEGTTLEVALQNHGGAVADALQTLQPRVNGEAVDNGYVIEDGATIVLVEPNLKLGS